MRLYALYALYGLYAFKYLNDIVNFETEKLEHVINVIYFFSKINKV